MTTIPIHVDFAIREAVKLLAASSTHFKSRQVAQARRLLELCLAELPPRGPQLEPHEQKTIGRQNS